MPTYEYRCAKCGQHVEVYQSFSEAPLTKHQGCGGKLTKVLSPAGIVLKGSGFYKTDNRGGKKSASKPAASDGSGSTSDTSTSGKSSDGSTSTSGADSKGTTGSSSSSTGSDAKSA
jgi:putative FmdB family regulatory protein